MHLLMIYWMLTSIAFAAKKESCDNCHSYDDCVDSCEICTAESSAATWTDAQRLCSMIDGLNTYCAIGESWVLGWKYRCCTDYVFGFVQTAGCEPTPPPTPKPTKKPIINCEDFYCDVCDTNEMEELPIDSDKYPALCASYSSLYPAAIVGKKYEFWLNRMIWRNLNNGNPYYYAGSSDYIYYVPSANHWRWGVNMPDGGYYARTIDERIDAAHGATWYGREIYVSSSICGYCNGKPVKDPYCDYGQIENDQCWHSNCKQLGGSGCGKSGTHCCDSHWKGDELSCNEATAPCYIDNNIDYECRKGQIQNNKCWHSNCKQLGGSGCDTAG
eukprot:127030_1